MVWTFKIRQSRVAADSSPRYLGIPTFASAPSLDQRWTRFSGCAVVSSTALAPASTRGGSKCDGYQETANCLPSLSVSKLSLKSRDKISCTTEGVRDCETFSGTCRGPQCQFSFGSCGYLSTCWTFRRCGDDPRVLLCYQSTCWTFIRCGDSLTKHSRMKMPICAR